MNPYSETDDAPFRVEDFKQRLIQLGYEPIKSARLSQLLAETKYIELSELSGEIIVQAMDKLKASTDQNNYNVLLVCGQHWEALTHDGLQSWIDFNQRNEQVCQGEIGTLLGMQIFTDALVGDTLGNVSRVVATRRLVR